MNVSTLTVMEQVRQIEVERAVWAAAVGPRHGSPVPFQLLVEGARHHPDPSVRRTALAALDRIDDDQVLGTALAALRDEVPGVRRQAVQVVARRVHDDRVDVRPYLRVLVRADPSPLVRRAAARALGAVVAERPAA